MSVPLLLWVTELVEMRGLQAVVLRVASPIEDGFERESVLDRIEP